MQKPIELRMRVVEAASKHGERGSKGEVMAVGANNRPSPAAGVPGIYRPGHGEQKERESSIKSDPKMKHTVNKNRCKDRPKIDSKQ